MRQYIDIKNIEVITNIFLEELQKRCIRIENIDLVNSWIIHKIFVHEKNQPYKVNRIEIDKIKSWAPGFDLYNNKKKGTLTESVRGRMG